MEVFKNEKNNFCYDGWTVDGRLIEHYRKVTEKYVESGKMDYISTSVLVRQFIAEVKVGLPIKMKDRADGCKKVQCSKHKFTVDFENKYIKFIDIFQPEREDCGGYVKSMLIDCMMLTTKLIEEYKNVGLSPDGKRVVC